jgi:hypothetical protein
MYLLPCSDDPADCYNEIDMSAPLEPEPTLPPDFTDAPTKAPVAPQAAPAAPPVTPTVAEDPDAGTEQAIYTELNCADMPYGTVKEQIAGPYAFDKTNNNPITVVSKDTAAKTVTVKVRQTWKTSGTISWVAVEYKDPAGPAATGGWVCNKRNEVSPTSTGDKEYTLKCNDDGYATINTFVHDGSFKSAPCEGLDDGFNTLNNDGSTTLANDGVARFLAGNSGKTTVVVAEDCTSKVVVPSYCNPSSDDGNKLAAFFVIPCNCA